MSVECKVCGFSGLDISQHIKSVHSMAKEEYYDKFKSPIISQSIIDKRKNTTMEKHGDPNWRNEEARNLMYSNYEGGHPLRDEKVRLKGKDTKLRRYGNANYTNQEQREHTNIKKYGVAHSCAAPEVIGKRLKTLKERYGKVFNCPKQERVTPDNPEAFKIDYESGLSYSSLCVKYNKSEPIISRWVKDMGLHRSIKPQKKEYEKPKDTVDYYLKVCYRNGRTLSFYEYSKIAGDPRMNRLKRLFNNGRKYALLKEELYRVAGDQSLYLDFLGNFN